MKELLATSFSMVLRRYGPVVGTLLLLLSFLLPIWPRGLPVLIAASIVGLMIRFRPWRIPRRMYFVRTPVLTFSAMLFILHVMGLLWSQDIVFGLQDVGMKLSLLLFPLAFFLVPVRLRCKKEFALMFIKGAFYAVLLCLFLALIRVGLQGVEGPWHLQFTFSAFSVLVHPSYFAMYLCVALVIWFIYGFHKLVEPFASIVLPAVLCLGILLTGSKSGWLIMFLSFIVLIYHLRDDRTVVRTMLAYLVVFGVGGLGLYLSSEYVRFRVDEMVKTVFNEESVADPSTSSAVRSAIWGASMQLIREEPILGHGTGDVKNVLLNEYEIRGMHSAVEKRLNAHSQYLQSAVALGMVGFSVILLLFVVSIIHARRNHNFALVAFLTVVAANWLVESMLEVQAGIVFFAWGTFILSLKGSRGT